MADASAFEQLTLARKLVASVTSEKAGSLGIAVVGFDADAAAAVTRNAVAAALAAAFPMPAFKSDAPRPKIKSIRVAGLPEKIDLDRVRSEADGNNLARWLTAMPPNKLDAAGYADLVREIAKERGWQYKRYSVKELDKMGAGAFLAVAQGNDDDSASIVRLRYRPGTASATPGISIPCRFRRATSGSNLHSGPIPAFGQFASRSSDSARERGIHFVRYNDACHNLECWTRTH